jgi:glycosyltransferase involved in cell wall biosynthesis
VQFIPNGVDAQRFSPGSSDQRSRWGVADDETVILLARRLVAKNGVGVFAQAVTLLKSAGYRVIVAGDGPERKRIERILSNAGVRERCVLLGAVPNSLMPDIFRAADLSVLPSFLEATSITGLESMATGLPLVGTRVGGIPTLIADRETGLLVSPGNASELAAAMDTLVADSSLRKTMGQAARARAVEQFSWTSIARRTAAVYSIYARRAAA